MDPAGISAWVVCRLIALDKSPGVKQIDLTVIGTAVTKTISEDIQTAAGPLQVCAEHLAGCEAAVHAMRQVFESPEMEAVILLEATNAPTL